MVSFQVLRRRTNRRSHLIPAAFLDDDFSLSSPLDDFFAPLDKRDGSLTILEVPQLAPATATATYTYLVADSSTYQLVDPTTVTSAVTAATSIPSSLATPAAVVNPKAPAPNPKNGGTSSAIVTATSSEDNGSTFGGSSGHTAVVVIPPTVATSVSTVATPSTIVSVATETVTESTTVVIPPASTSTVVVVNTSAASSVDTDSVFGGTSSGHTAVVVLPTTSATPVVVTSTVTTIASEPSSSASQAPPASSASSTSTVETVFTLSGEGHTAVIVIPTTSATPAAVSTTDAVVPSSTTPAPAVITTSPSTIPIVSTTSEQIFSTGDGYTALVSSLSSYSSLLSSSSVQAVIQSQASVSSSIAFASSSAAASSSSSAALATSSAAGDGIVPPVSVSPLPTSTTTPVGGAGATTTTGKGGKPPATTTSAGAGGDSGNGNGGGSGTSGDSTSGFFSSVSRPASIGLTTLVCVAIALVVIGIAILIFRCCSPKRRRERKRRRGLVVLSDKDHRYHKREIVNRDPFRDPEMGDEDDEISERRWVTESERTDDEYYEDGTDYTGGAEEDAEVTRSGGIWDRRSRRRFAVESRGENGAGDEEFHAGPSPRTVMTARVPSSDWTSIVGDRVWPDPDDARSTNTRNRIPSIVPSLAAPPLPILGGSPAYLAATRGGLAPPRKLSTGHPLRTASVYSPEMNGGQGGWITSSSQEDDDESSRIPSDEYTEEGDDDGSSLASARRLFTQQQQEAALLRSPSPPLPVATRPAPLPPTSPVRGPFFSPIITPPTPITTRPAAVRQGSWKVSLDKVMGTAAEVLAATRRPSFAASSRRPSIATSSRRPSIASRRLSVAESMGAAQPREMEEDKYTQFMTVSGSGGAGADNASRISDSSIVTPSFATSKSHLMAGSLASRRGNTRPPSIIVPPAAFADDDLSTPVSSTYSEMFLYKPA